MKKNSIYFHSWGASPISSLALRATGWYSHNKPIFPVMKLWKDAWVFDYSYNRHGKVRVGSTDAEWHDRLPGTGHLYPPGTRYWEDTLLVDRAIQGGYVVFSGDCTKEFAAFIQPGRSYARVLDTERMLATPLQDMARIGHMRGDCGYWQALSVFCLLMDILREAKYSGDVDFIISREFVKKSESTLAARVRSFLLNNLTDKITLRDISTAMHVSPSTLSHQYRRETGTTPMQTLIDLRMGKADALLQRGMLLEEIARETGFYDAFHFSKTYKKHRGFSPRNH